MAHARATALHLASHLLAAAAGHWVWTHREAVGAATGAAALAAAQLVRGHLLWFTSAKPLGKRSNNNLHPRIDTLSSYSNPLTKLCIPPTWSFFQASSSIFNWLRPWAGPGVATLTVF